MKQSKKWLALILISSQLLATIPVSADVAASVSDTQVAKQPATLSKTEEIETTENTSQEAIAEDTNTSEQQTSQEVQNETDVSQPDTDTTEEAESKPAPVEETETTEAIEETTEDSKAETELEVEPETEVSTPHEEITESTDAKTTKPAQAASTSNEATISPTTATKTQSNEQIVTNKSDETPKAVTIETTSQDTWNFIKVIGESARKIGLEEDLYASVMIAQAVLESGGGTSQLSQAPYYNLFGIKGTYQGHGVSFTTREDNGDGTLSTISSTFRQYDSVEESLSDYAKLLKEGITGNKDFYQGVWKSNTTSYKEATTALTGRYASDTHYDQKLNALIEAYDLTSYDQEKITLPTENSELIYPVSDPVVSSNFGIRGAGFHRGVDFAAPAGTAIRASLSGTVVRSEYHYSWGNYVAIEHENGLTTLYAHNTENLVVVGQTVTQGEVIATMGSTGNSTGPHLHFEVSLSPTLAQEQLIDPLSVLTK